MGFTIFNHNIGCKQPVRFNTIPYFAYVINAKYIVEFEKNDFVDVTNEFPRFDYGIKVGLSIAFGSFEPTFGYDFGLNSISDYGDSSGYNRGFYFTVAMVFGK